MATTVTGKMVTPNGTPIVGATITAYLNDFGAESNSLEVYPSGVLVTTTSDSNGLWSLALWPTAGSVTSTKYTFSIQANSNTVPKEYNLEVPNQGTVLFSDLLVGWTTRDTNMQLLETEPAQYDFTIYKGVTFYREFLLEDLRNEPINLTNYSAKMQVVDQYDSVILTAATGTGNSQPTVLTVNSNGYLTVYFNTYATSILTGTKAKYDILLIYGSDIYKILEGTITIESTITSLS